MLVAIGFFWTTMRCILLWMKIYCCKKTVGINPVES
jgi:hypothetical protein